MSTLTTVPCDDVAVVELDDRAGDGVLERHAVEVVGDHLARGVLTASSKVPMPSEAGVVADGDGGCVGRSWSDMDSFAFFPDGLPRPRT